MDLFEHMRNLWDTIGFIPTAFQLPEREIVDDIDGSQSSSNLIGDQKIIVSAELQYLKFCQFFHLEFSFNLLSSILFVDLF